MDVVDTPENPASNRIEEIEKEPEIPSKPKDKKEVQNGSTVHNQEIFDYLKELGACNSCCLRFLKAHGDHFLCVESSLLQRGISIRNSDYPNKKIRTTCSLCLGLLEDSFLDKVMEKVSEASATIEKYKCGKIYCSISLPIILQLRQLRAWMALIKRFEHISRDTPPDTALKDVVKTILNWRVCKLTERRFDSNGIMLGFNFAAPDETVELRRLADLRPDVFASRRANKKCGREFITRNAFERHFVPATLDTAIFDRLFPLPIATESGLELVGEVTVTGPMVFCAGRYAKFSRQLSQTPWVLEGRRVMEDSVQELITRVMAPVFGVEMEAIVFSASGREDVDVRCLGRGRPFVLEIPDAKRVELSADEAKGIEERVEASEVISVRDVQIVQREETIHVKSGEEEKRKIYRALCCLESPVTEEILRKLDLPEGFQTRQTTPLRVLHRRPLIVRPRRVFSLKATAAPETSDRALVLDVQTEAGTYIKELVHGEFGRTVPSIRSILGVPIDIQALDVMAIELDWPKEVNRS